MASSAPADGVTCVYMCVGCLVCSPTRVTFITAYHDADDNVNDWTEWLRRFNRGSVMPLSLMLLGFGVCVCVFKKSQSVY